MEITNETHTQYAVVHPRTISNMIWRKNENVLCDASHFKSICVMYGLILCLYKMIVLLYSPAAVDLVKQLFVHIFE